MSLTAPSGVNSSSPVLAPFSIEEAPGSQSIKVDESERVPSGSSRLARRKSLCIKITKIVAVCFSAMGIFALGGRYMPDITRWGINSSAPNLVSNNSSLELSNGTILANLSTGSSGFASLTGPTLSTFSTTGGSVDNASTGIDSLTGLTSSLTGISPSSTGAPSSLTGTSPSSTAFQSLNVTENIANTVLDAYMLYYNQYVGVISFSRYKEVIYPLNGHLVNYGISFPPEPIAKIHNVRVYDTDRCPEDSRMNATKIADLPLIVFNTLNGVDYNPTIRAQFIDQSQNVLSFVNKVIAVMAFRNNVPYDNVVKICGVLRSYIPEERW